MQARKQGSEFSSRRLVSAKRFAEAGRPKPEPGSRVANLTIRWSASTAEFYTSFLLSDVLVESLEVIKRSL